MFCLYFSFKNIIHKIHKFKVVSIIYYLIILSIKKWLLLLPYFSIYSPEIQPSTNKHQTSHFSLWLENSAFYQPKTLHAVAFLLQPFSLRFSLPTQITFYYHCFYLNYTSILILTKSIPPTRQILPKSLPILPNSPLKSRPHP